MRLLFLLLFMSSIRIVFSQTDIRGNQSPDYFELIDRYKKIAAEHREIELYNMGPSDYGLPIYLCVINGAEDSVRTFEKARNETTVLINNAIHPGEPDGVNACLIWIEDWIAKGKSLKKLPVIAIIPAYNVGGMMKRSGTSRANQNGPEEYGFRGNAQNLDLNRDCIKMDTKNMFTFARIYHALEPDIFMDTHVTNGADYQYTMTYIATPRKKMPDELGELTYGELIPYLENSSEEKGFPLIPYVNLKGSVPEEGIELFNDLPRYIMGYTALFHTISFTLETHMLKAFPDRVKATFVFIDEAIKWSGKHSVKIESARKEAFENDLKAEFMPLNYSLCERKDSIPFLGYEHQYEVSSVTEQERLKYDQEKPYERYIPFYCEYKVLDSVRVPKFYVVEGQNDELIRRLKANNIQMLHVMDFKRDSVQGIRIMQFESPDKPYEGHFLHSSVQVRSEEMAVTLKPGDVLIPTNQKYRRFITQVIEPTAADSYFNWNFFDSYMQQKEYFSPYVFEEKAAELLKDPSLKEAFEERKRFDVDFSSSRWEQLYFLYTKSSYFEPTVNLLPIYRIY